jgi:hypothetical protein
LLSCRKPATTLAALALAGSGAQLAEVGRVRGFVYLERAEGASPRAPPVRTPTAGRSETARAKSRLVRC